MDCATHSVGWPLVAIRCELGQMAVDVYTGPDQPLFGRYNPTRREPTLFLTLLKVPRTNAPPSQFDDRSIVDGCLDQKQGVLGG